MTVLVSTLFTELQYLLQEPGDWTTNALWTSTEVINYINTVSKDLILRSQVVKQHDTLNVTVGTRIYADPPNTMEMDRVAYNERALYRTNRYLLDKENPKWRTLSGTPKQFHQDQLPTRTFEVDRAPTGSTASGYTAVGNYGVLRQMVGSFGYTGVIPGVGRGGVLREMSGSIPYAAVLTNTPNSGTLRQMAGGTPLFEVISTTLPAAVTSSTDALTVPDYCVLYLKFGVLAKMLAKEGEAQDLPKAKYCQARYDNGIRLLRQLMGSTEKMAPTAGD